MRNGEISYRLLKPFELRIGEGDIQKLHADIKAALDEAERRGIERAAVCAESEPDRGFGECPKEIAHAIRALTP